MGSKVYTFRRCILCVSLQRSLAGGGRTLPCKVGFAAGIDTVPVIGYWPDGVKAVAHLSHDSDLNIDCVSRNDAGLLKPFAVNSTWCMMEPGYSPHIYERVKEAGHELALHYNALEEQNGKWDRREFRRQYHWLKEAAELDA